MGLAKPIGSDRLVLFGLKGEADIQGILMGGRAIAIEVKTGTGSLTPEQIAFKNMWEKFGGLYIEARSVEDVLTIVNSLT